jgi:hypothetical protein
MPRPKILSLEIFRPNLFYPRTASINGCGTAVAALLAVARFAVALWMKPPPSTRAWPEAAS